MKRKLFSAILFGALLTASTSGLTSCKDYDDDIQNLQSQIDKLATAEQLSAKVTELQGQIEKAKADAVSAADAAKKVGEAAQKSADDAASAAAAAKKAAEDIAASAATKDDLKAAADAAQKAVEAIQSEVAGKTSPEDVKAAIDAALADVLAEVEEHHNAILELDEELNGEGGIAERLAAAEQAIEEGAAEVDLAPIKQLIEDFEKKAQEILGTAFEMVTSVSLYTSGAATEFSSTPGLKFWLVEEKANKFPADEKVANGQFEFKDGEVKLYDDSLLVRVSPVDAEITPEMVSLINSQGKTLSSDFVEVKEVVRYNRKPLMRSTSDSNGLWVVKFKAQDNFNVDAFVKETTNGKTGNALQKVLYAVAINNTADATDGRRVISEYDVTVETGDKTDPKDLLVDGKSVFANVGTGWAGYKNRYNVQSGYTEYTWKDDAAVTPDFGNNGNTLNNDDRASAPVYVADIDKEIPIELKGGPVKGFYVTLDWTRAYESGVSEINAWNSYKYENVGVLNYKGDVMVPATLFEGNKGSITITDLANMSLVGDVIGFRVFAVNLDGTLQDPDGIPFYVGVGAQSQSDDKTLENKDIVITSSNASNTGLIDVTGVFGGLSYDAIEWSITDGPDKNFNNYVKPTIGTASEDVVVSYWKDEWTAATATTNCNNIKVTVSNAVKLFDGATYTIKATLKKNIDGNSSYDVRRVTFNITKVMPADVVPHAIQFNALQDKYQVMTPSAFNITPANYGWGWFNNAATPATGSLDLNQVFVYDNSVRLTNSGYTAYKYDIANSAWKNPSDHSKGTIAVTANSSSTYKLSGIDAAFVDGTTEHGITAKYTYSNISHRQAVNGSGQPVADTYDSDNNYDAVAAATPTLVYMPYSVQGVPGFMQYAAQRVKTANASGSGDTYTPAKYETKNYIVWANATASESSPKTVSSFISATQIRYKAGVKVASIVPEGLPTGGSPTAAGTNLSALCAEGILAICDVWTEYNGIRNPYFKPTLSGNTWTMEQIANKVDEHNETLKVVVMDAFGHVETISLPIRILNAAPALGIDTDATEF